MSTADFTPNTDELVGHNGRFAAEFDHGDLTAPPTRALAIVTCMDARLNVLGALGLAVGEAHVIRNAGGVITDDVIRSLTLSQRSLGTREIVVMHHTSCGLEQVDEPAFKAQLEAEVGVKPAWSLEGFADPHADVLQSMRRIELSPFLPHKDHIRGFVYDVATGAVDEVSD
ncbi:MAG: carbonic anhydrase [Actinomycetota bacterium]